MKIIFWSLQCCGGYQSEVKFYLKPCTQTRPELKQNSISQKLQFVCIQFQFCRTHVKLEFYETWYQIRTRTRRGVSLVKKLIRVMIKFTKVRELYFIKNKKKLYPYLIHKWTPPSQVETITCSPKIDRCLIQVMDFYLIVTLIVFKVKLSNLLVHHQ